MKQGINKICYGFFSALANPTRLAILERLQGGSMNVSGLAHLLDQEQSMISHNLKLLEQCHFVTSEKRGKEKWVYLNESIIKPIFALVEKHSERFCDDKKNCPFIK